MDKKDITQVAQQVGDVITSIRENRRIIFPIIVGLLVAYITYRAFKD